MSRRLSRSSVYRGRDATHVGAVAVRPAAPPGHGWPRTDLATIRARIEQLPLDVVLAATNRESAAIADVQAAARTIEHGPLAGYTISLAGLAAVAQQALLVSAPQGYVPPRDRIPLTACNAVRAGAIDVYYHPATNLEGSVRLRNVTEVFYRLTGVHAGAQTRYRYTIPRYLSLFQQPIQGHHALGATLGDAFVQLTGIPYELFVFLAGLVSVASLTLDSGALQCRDLRRVVHTGECGEGAGTTRVASGAPYRCDPGILRRVRRRRCPRRPRLSASPTLDPARR